ncbi:hypothetical protein ACH42_17080 [Endozoicomonas sp. (ex Bugula neritina AB1)]|nr:hypothetical protein ACH42_17080 [Endozoicomonas sp. (ex Bugula neritina AB1)]
MTYCDQNGMITRYGESELVTLTDTSDTGQIDSDALHVALSDASDEIDSYLAVRHSLPLESTPDILVRLCADITRYRLYDDRMLDEVESRYKDSIKLLRDIARGTAQLPIKELTSPAGEVASTKTSNDRIFTKESLEGF